MRMLQNTDKKLTIEEIIKEIDQDNKYDYKLLGAFIVWASKNGYYSYSAINLQEDSCKKWLKNYPQIQTWFVEYGFAEWEDDFKPFDLTIETKDEAIMLWHRLNMPEEEFKNTAYYRQEESQLKKRNVSVISIWHQLDSKLKKMGVIIKEAKNATIN